MSRMKNMFSSTHPQMISLCRKYRFLLTQTGDVSAHTASQDTILHQKNNKLHLFVRELIYLYK